MPLQPGSDDATIAANIKQLMAEGYSQQQAIAMDMANRSKEERQDA